MALWKNKRLQWPINTDNDEGNAKQYCFLGIICRWIENTRTEMVSQVLHITDWKILSTKYFLWNFISFWIKLRKWSSNLTVDMWITFFVYITKSHSSSSYTPSCPWIWHMDARRTLDKVNKSQYYWPHLRKGVQDYVTSFTFVKSGKILVRRRELTWKLISAEWNSRE